MTPQRSNRSALVEGALRCIETRPAAVITAREIAAESGANLASIGYHFGSKDELVAEAMAEGFRRWLAEVNARIGSLAEADPAVRLRRAVGLVIDTADRHQGLMRAFFAALAGAVHDEDVRRTLAESLQGSRTAVAELLGLGDDDAGRDVAGLLIALSDGLLIQALLGMDPGFDAKRIAAASTRLAEIVAQGG